MDWNYVRVDRTRNDITIGINMSVEEARECLEDLQAGLPLSELSPSSQMLHDALFSAAHTDKRKDSSEGSLYAPSVPQTSPERERDITDESSSPDA